MIAKEFPYLEEIFTDSDIEVEFVGNLDTIYMATNSDNIIRVGLHFLVLHPALQEMIIYEVIYIKNNNMIPLIKWDESTIASVKYMIDKYGESCKSVLLGYFKYLVELYPGSISTPFFQRSIISSANKKTLELVSPLLM